MVRWREGTTQGQSTLQLQAFMTCRYYNLAKHTATPQLQNMSITLFIDRFLRTWIGQAKWIYCALNWTWWPKRTLGHAAACARIWQCSLRTCIRYIWRYIFEKTYGITWQNIEPIHHDVTSTFYFMRNGSMNSTPHARKHLRHDTKTASTKQKDWKQAHFPKIKFETCSIFKN